MLEKEEQTPEQRINEIYLAIFSRTPSAKELTEAIEFLNQQGEIYGVATLDRLKDEKVWTDLCHVMLNVKEFVFVN